MFQSFWVEEFKLVMVNMARINFSFNIFVLEFFPNNIANIVSIAQLFLHPIADGKILSTYAYYRAWLAIKTNKFSRTWVTRWIKSP